MTHDNRPIGVFDSGMGGLTVLKALRACLPAERFVYLGDTARLPYGIKSAATVKAYAVQATRLLAREDTKLIVIACNTASAVALDALRAGFAPTPVIGVVEPGARAAAAATRVGRVAVIATESTVRGGAYAAALQAAAPGIAVTQQACPLFVALAEEGWTDGEVTLGTARRYLDPVFKDGAAPDTLLLGCTHFPVLRPAFEKVIGPDVRIVDSAATTARAVAAALGENGLAAKAGASGGWRLLASDSPERFARVGAIFLGEPIAASDVTLVDVK